MWVIAWQLWREQTKFWPCIILVLSSWLLWYIYIDKYKLKHDVHSDTYEMKVSIFIATPRENDTMSQEAYMLWVHSSVEINMGVDKKPPAIFPFRHRKDGGTKLTATPLTMVQRTNGACVLGFAGSDQRLAADVGGLPLDGMYWGAESSGSTWIVVEGTFGYSCLDSLIVSRYGVKISTYWIHRAGRAYSRVLITRPRRTLRLHARCFSWRDWAEVRRWRSGYGWFRTMILYVAIDRVTVWKIYGSSQRLNG